MQTFLLHIKFFGILLLITGILCACESSVLIDERGDDLQLYDYYIDEDGNEGVVIYVYNLRYAKSSSGYIVVLSIDEATLSWGPVDKEIIQADSELFQTERFSASMQYAMLREGIQQFPAQAWCYAKNRKGQIGIGSWRLPSLDDWKNYIPSDSRLDKINSALIKMGGVPLSQEEHYWTCTEDYENAFTLSSIEYQDFDAANRAINVSVDVESYINKDRWIKSNMYKVRAIKYVYYKK